MIIFIIGPQGSGKTAIANAIIEIAKVENIPVPLLVDEVHYTQAPEKLLLDRKSVV